MNKSKCDFIYKDNDSWSIDKKPINNVSYDKIKSICDKRGIATDNVKPTTLIDNLIKNQKVRLINRYYKNKDNIKNDDLCKELFDIIDFTNDIKERTKSSAIDALQSTITFKINNSNNIIKLSECNKNNIKADNIYAGNDKYYTYYDDSISCKIKICKPSQINKTNCANKICNISNNKICAIPACQHVSQIDDICLNTKNKLCKKKCYNYFDLSNSSLYSISRSWMTEPSIVDTAIPNSVIKCYNNFCLNHKWGVSPDLIQNNQIAKLPKCDPDQYINMYSQCFTIAKCDNNDFKINKNTQYVNVCKKPIDPAKFPISQADYNTENKKFCKL